MVADPEHEFHARCTGEDLSACPYSAQWGYLAIVLWLVPHAYTSWLLGESLGGKLLHLLSGGLHVLWSAFASIREGKESNAFVAARFVESGVEAPLQLMAQLYITFTKYRLGALSAGDLALLVPSMALSLVSLAKANSDMYDRKTITERTATRRPSGWTPAKNAAVIVEAKTTLRTADGTTIERVEGDSLFLREAAAAEAGPARAKLDWYSRLMRGQRAEHAEGEVELAALARPASFGGYVLWTLASML